MPITPEMRTLFRGLESKYGLPEGYLSGAGGIESHYNPNAHRPGSQFMGMFQLGQGVRNTYGVRDPYDMVQNADAAAQYARDNAKILTRKLGREPTPGELYIAHQQGAGGASKLLLHPHDPAGSLVSDKYVAANGGDPNAPASQFVEKFTNKFTGGRSPLMDYINKSYTPSTHISHPTTTPAAIPGPLTPPSESIQQPTQVAEDKKDPAIDEVAKLISSFRKPPTPAEATQLPAPQFAPPPNPMEAQLAMQQRISAALQKLNAMRR